MAGHPDLGVSVIGVSSDILVGGRLAIAGPGLQQEAGAFLISGMN
jgi:hypothetical protein